MKGLSSITSHAVDAGDKVQYGRKARERRISNFTWVHKITTKGTQQEGWEPLSRIKTKQANHVPLTPATTSHHKRLDWEPGSRDTDLFTRDDHKPEIGGSNLGLNILVWTHRTTVLERIYNSCQLIIAKKCHKSFRIL